MKRIVLFVVALCATGALQAQSWPSKPVRVAVNVAAGGVADLTMRVLGVRLAESLKLRMLAVAGGARHPDYPDVPTLDESGIRDVDGGPHFGVYAPAGTPRGVIDRLNAEMQKVMKEPAVRDRFRTLAVDVAEPMSPEAFAAYVRGQSERYAKLIPEIGIKR